MRICYPLSIYRYLRSVSRHTKDFVYLKLDSGHRVIDSGGRLDRYGLGHLDCSVPIDEQFDPLSALLPVNGQAVTLLNVNLSNNRYIDIHIINDELNEWVVLTENTKEGRKKQSAQQRQLNDDLLRERRSLS